MELRIGTKVKIRSLDWINNNYFVLTSNGVKTVGPFTEDRYEYFDNQAVIIESEQLINSYDHNSKVWIYKLNIDSGKWGWQDYMFDPKYIIDNNIIAPMCINLCKMDQCYDSCPLFIQKNGELLNVGDKVLIRSIEWFDMNSQVYNHVGCFIYEMSKYCGEEAIITNIETLNGNIKYKLNIDNGKYDWQDYMFDFSSFLRKFEKFCETGCIYECKKDKCKLFKYKNK